MFSEGRMNPAQTMDAVQRCLEGQDTPGRDLERGMALAAHDSLADFIFQNWASLEPGTPLEWSWYHDLICRQLERVTRGEITNLVICIPPGFAKSLIVSVFWPAWWWLRDPTRSFLATSGAEDLAMRDNQRMREVITHDWYVRLVSEVARVRGGPIWGLAKDQNQKRSFLNDCKGRRMCFTISGSPTGHRAHVQIIDDPHQIKDIIGTPEQVAANLGDMWNKVNTVLATRYNDPRKPVRVIIAQRVHLLDVAGRVMKEEDPETVVLQMHYDPEFENNHPEDPRTQPGQLLDPVRMPPVIVDQLTKRLDVVPGQARAQLEQRPIPTEGGTFKREWMNNIYSFDPMRPDTKFPRVFITVDTTFKDSRRSDFVSMQAWGVRGHQRYLLGEIYERMSYVAFKNALRDYYITWRPWAVLIEAKANGEAVMDDLKGIIPCMIGFMPDRYGDKTSRANLSTNAWAAGNVHLPEPEYVPTVGAYKQDLLGFPQIGRDRTDGMSQLFIWLNEENSASAEAYVESGSQVIKELMKQLRAQGLPGLPTV